MALRWWYMRLADEAKAALDAEDFERAAQLLISILDEKAAREADDAPLHAIKKSWQDMPTWCWLSPGGVTYRRRVGAGKDDK